MNKENNPPRRVKQGEGDRMVIISGNANRPLAEAIAHDLGKQLIGATIGTFSDKERQVILEESVRDLDAFVIHPTATTADASVNDHLVELLVIIDALKRASADRITAVIPYYGYARQDRKAKPRAPISAKLMANLITAAGANRVLAMDLHAAQIQGFFDIPVDHLFASGVILEYLCDAYKQNIVVVSPDTGGAERARHYAKKLGASLAVIDKRRSAPGENEVMNVIGEVDGKTAIIVDDMIDTAGTLVKAVDALLERGAVEVVGVAVHAVLSGQAVDRIATSRLKELVVANTIPLSEAAKSCSKFRVLSVHKLFAEAIRRIHAGLSVSSMFEE